MNHMMLSNLPFVRALGFLTALVLLGTSNPALAEEPFVDLDPGFVLVDTGIDSTGVTYVLGQRRIAGVDAGVIKKYNASGLQVAWEAQDIDSGPVFERPLSGLPTAVSVASNGSLYVMSDTAKSVVRLDAGTGVQDVDLDSGNSVQFVDAVFAGSEDLTYSDVFFSSWDDRVYVCGDYDADEAATANFGGGGGWGRTGRRTFIFRLNEDLTPTGQGRSMGTGGGENSARSIVVDEAGNIYACGQLGNGKIASTGLSSQNIEGNDRGYVIKWNSNFTDPIIYQHFQEDSADVNKAAEFAELTFSQGWVYAIGKYADISMNRVDVLKLDSNLTLKRMAVVEQGGTFQIQGRGITSDQFGNVYISGAYGGGSAEFFGDASIDDLLGNVDGDEDPSHSIAASTEGVLFVAKLNAEFGFDWVLTPEDPLPSTFGNSAKVRWNRALSKLFWSGDFSGGSLKLGDSEPGGGEAANGFLAVVESDGTYTRRVKLNILSDFGVSGSQVRPFGGPRDPNSTAPDDDAIDENDNNTRYLIKGSPVVAAVPAFLYRSILGGDITDSISGDPLLIDEHAETRIVSQGFSLSNNNGTVEEGDAQSYNFTIEDDGVLTFHWRVEHAFRIESDFTDTIGLDESGNEILPGLNSAGVGRPEPAINKHWVEEGTPVISEIEGFVQDIFSLPGLQVRYIVQGFEAYGSANSNTDRSLDVTNYQDLIPDDPLELPTIDGVGIDFFALEPPYESRRHIPVDGEEGFVMYGPGGISFVWKLQYGILVSTSGNDSSSLPFIEMVDEPAVRKSLVEDGILPPQQDGYGAGTHWYDVGTHLRIGTRRDIDESKSLKGWQNGDGLIFANEGTKNSLSTRVVGGVPYMFKDVPRFLRPARVAWDYGDTIFFETVEIGRFVTFNANRGILAEPTISVLDPVSESVGDMVIWDPEARRLYPIKEGTFELKWTQGDLIFTNQVVSKMPTAAHYPHVANVAGVDLDPDPDDEFFFKQILNSEGDASLNSQGNFVATEKGRSVLLFSRLDNIAGGRGTPVEFVDVKVVETQTWQQRLKTSDRPVQIGERITSEIWDKAGLRTGYVINPTARFNPFIYDRDAFEGLLLNDDPGPVIPVNLHPGATSSEKLAVVWYADPATHDKLLWPHAVETFLPQWPTEDDPASPGGLHTIVIATRDGSDSQVEDPNDSSQLVDQVVLGPAVDASGLAYPAETTLNPIRVEQVAIYNQPDPSAAGYNANEEHALIAPSFRFRTASPIPDAAYALREGDLNVYNANSETEQNQPDDYTSHPFVLVQFFDKVDLEFKMRVYQVELGTGFEQVMEAGEAVTPYYPLEKAIGASPCPGTYGREGNPTRRVRWRDHKGTFWAVSGEDVNGTGNPGEFGMYFYYPLTPDFWWPRDGSGNPTKNIGDCVAWLPDTPGYAEDRFKNKDNSDTDYDGDDENVAAQKVTYKTVWPDVLPVLKVGETLTFSGGEYKLDFPTEEIINSDGERQVVDTPGLPAVLGWAAGRVVYDELNPAMTSAKHLSSTGYTARIYPALEERRIPLTIEDFPASLRPGGEETTVKGGNYFFINLPSSLQKRVYYDPLTEELVMKGFVNDKDIGDETLTAAPPAVYVLEPNVMTESEKNQLLTLSAESTWTGAVRKLFSLSRNPQEMDLDSQTGPDSGVHYVGLQQKVLSNGTTVKKADALQALGAGLAVYANPDFLDPNAGLPDVSYVTLAENEHPSLGGSPVVLHVIKVQRKGPKPASAYRYRGAIKTVLSDNVFDENVILRHTGDFGTNAKNLVFEWWYRPEDGTTYPPPDFISPGTANPWKIFSNPNPEGSGHPGSNFYQLTLAGNPSAPEALLADTLWFVRYRHKDEEPADNISWEQESGGKIPFTWAGAGNSDPFNDFNEDLIPDYVAQLAQGWIKRVLDAINPYEARIRDFEGDNPATYSSMIQALGAPFLGPVALNPDKNVIENVGLIELYSTVLQRGRSLSIDASNYVPNRAIENALLLAATRLADFYALLGNEAYSDALNPAIGFGTNSVEYGSLAPTVFSFQNMVASQLDEELALLRGVDDFYGRPVFNRLFWNFVKGEGEAAYALNYNISDINTDGFIDEADAMVLYPQGHGDAWGHYLTALRGQYGLLRHELYNWSSRSEYYNLQDIVIPVDFLDERKFAEIAAAKAKAGAAIVNSTYRQKYVEDPTSQWQGYNDPDEARAWGVEEWSRRAGQGAYFDWITANALLPFEHPNSTFEGIQKVDRTTNKDIPVISANLNGIQSTFDEANGGLNPLGLAGNVVPFDIDPFFDGVQWERQTHFEQIYERAVGSLQNAVATFDNANQLDKMLRMVANDETEFRRSVFEEDLAYRNNLISIFGTPYTGMVGTGKAYPPGYKGPDTLLYMYVDINAITSDSVPPPTGGYQSNIGDAFKLAPFSNGAATTTVPLAYRTTHAESFDTLSNFTDSVLNRPVSYTYLPPDAPDPDDTFIFKLSELNLPRTASGYSFVAPGDWQIRRSPGELQQIIGQMLQQEAQVARAIADYDGLQGSIYRTMRLIVARYEMDEGIKAKLQEIIDKTETESNSERSSMITKGGLELGADIAQDLVDALAEIGEAPDNVVVGFSFGLGETVGSVANFIVRGISAVVKAGLKGGALAAEASALQDAIDREIATLKAEKDIDQLERNYALKEHLTELEDLFGDEAIYRVEIMREREALRELGNQYRAVLEEGFRLVDEQAAFNKRVAELTQRNRYQDMTFRVTRNDALEKYRESFDLAARYAYLAGKAYDYETNLAPNAAGSAQGILTNIVRQRGLGLLTDGEPQLGKGGLAEQLAWMKINYDNLKGQMGFNNPQSETGRFSLRHEKFRKREDSNAEWAGKLAEFVVDDLWDLPEFRRYCKPFAPEFHANGDPQPQAGIVIPFQTQIKAGENFFGEPLGPDDHAYDPSNFATKIRSVGVWFETNDGNADVDNVLPATPRVYLIPVGTDVLTVPDSSELATRDWNVLDQQIPVPLPVLGSNLNDPAWKPLNSLDGLIAAPRRFSSFRAYHDRGYLDESEMSSDSRLVGRSVWNRQWLLIIPGKMLNSEAEVGLRNFIYGPSDDPANPDGVTDIKLFFQTFGYSGR